MSIDIQKPLAPNVWYEVLNEAAPLAAGDYVLQAKHGHVDYAIGALEPGAGKSVVTLVPLQMAPITIPDGQVLRYRGWSVSAELHVLS